MRSEEAPEREATAYEVVERDARFIADGGKKGPLTVVKEVAAYASRNRAETLGGAMHEALRAINRKSTEANRYKTAVKVLLYALGARPLFGGPHLDVEGAIQHAMKALGEDGDTP